MMLGTVALPFLVFDLTKDVAAAGLATFVESSTRLAGSLFLSPYLARFGPRQCYPLFESLRIGAFGLLALTQYLRPSYGYAVSLGCAVCLASAAAVFNIVAEALLSDIEPASDRLRVCLDSPRRPSCGIY